MRSLPVILCAVLVACARPAREGSTATTQAPLWAATATQPSVARSNMPALVLPNGRVLVTGGGTAAVEIFDPVTETWASGPALSQPQTANLLALWAGRPVSIAGTRAESADPAVTSWTVLGTPAQARTGSTGTTLADGRVLVVGGAGLAGFQPELLELDGGFTLRALSNAAHVGHTANLLTPGQVAIVGGPTATAENYDPTPDLWVPRTGPERNLHTASLLPSGQLLLVGGRSLLDGGVAGAERYDPLTGVRTAVPGLRVPRLSHVALALPGGDVLVTGGEGPAAAGAVLGDVVLVTGGEGPAAARSAERYLLVLDRFVASGCLDTPRARHAGVVLLDGGAVLIGGVGLDGGALARSERLDFSTGLLALGQPCGLDCECGTGLCVDGVCCDTACGGGSPNTCLACSVARGAATDGTCAVVDATHVCRGVAGTCDVAEQCTGVDAGCPGDALRDAGVSCRGIAGICDFPEVCDGLVAQCPTDVVFDAGIACRNVAGLCDTPEACNGISGACPPDLVLGAGITCRSAVAGGCDVNEACDGLTAFCPTDRVADAGVVCRVSDAGCDLAETCTGSSPSCPADVIAAPGVPCRAAVGLCDVVELCAGARACPPDGVRDAGTVCRVSADACDAVDVCTGSSGACPDGFVDAGAPCRASTGACDVAESCTGIAAACPPDALRDAGAECRAAAGVCDRAETCTGTTASCPADGVLDAGAPCRAAAGACDVAETCNGLAISCPADVLVAAAVECRPGAGACDVAEACSGTAPACPPDAVQQSGFVCRTSAGSCDIAETCTGVGPDCPADALAAAETVCRPSTASCDPAETCGGNVDCPGDDAGTCADEKPKRYVGWSCTSAPELSPLLLILLIVVHAERSAAKSKRASARPSRHFLRRAGMSALRLRAFGPPLRATGLGVLLLASAVARAEAPITSDFAIRVNATLMRDLLASQIGAELGASVTLGTRIDAGLLLSLGRSLGGRLGLTWHMQDDGEWFRPFLQARALLHPVPEGIAGGGGAWGGVLVRAGPGRIQGGVIFEAYFGPKGYVPYDVFVTLGYELDLYRRIEREGVKPPPDFGGTDVLPLKPEPPPVVATPEPTLDVPKSEPRPPPVDDRTKVVTHVSLAKDLVTFDERRASWNTKGDTVVRRVIEVLKRYPQLQRVEIAGHADDADNDDECLKLSQRRAQSVLDALVRAGIEPNRLTAKGYGKLKNRVPVKGPARKREPNRRVDFIVLQEG